MPYFALVLVALNLKTRCYKIIYCVFSNRAKFNTLSWHILSEHQHLSPVNQSIFASMENLMMRLLMERSFSDINCLPTQWYLDWEKRYSGVVTLAFNKEDVMSKPLYIQVNENENHWVLVIAIPKIKLVVSYDPLKTDELL